MNSLFKHYTWKNFHCSYSVHASQENLPSKFALLLIHPIGVGLSGVFWHRFANLWQQKGYAYPLYNPDLLGCGKSDMPHLAYYPIDWAKQLQFFSETVIQKPVILVVQGALFPVAIKLIQNSAQSNFIKGLVLSGPPAWRTMTEAGNILQQQLIWNLFFDTPLGNLFYRYARRRQFLSSFSVRQLFAEAEEVDSEWLSFLETGATDLNSRYAVFSFLAGFWRENQAQAIQSIEQPTLVLFGEKASSISREGIAETPQKRLELYLKNFSAARGCIIPGRNVLPYESTEEFVTEVFQFVESIEG